MGFQSVPDYPCWVKTTRPFGQDKGFFVCFYLSPPSTLCTYPDQRGFDQITVVLTWSGCCVCLASKLIKALPASCRSVNWLLVPLPSLFFKVVLSCTRVRPAVPVRALGVRRVDTRLSRPPPTRSLHPQRVAPFRKLGPWSREKCRGHEILLRKWSFSFLK